MAVLSVIVEVRKVQESRAALSSVNSELAKTDSFAKRAGTSLTNFGSKAERLGKTLTKYVAVPLLALGTASGYMAAKFERSMNLIRTDAGGSAKEVGFLSREVLKLAKHSEFGPQKLADSLFYIESAGIRGGKAIKTLDQIQRAAMAGNADLEQAVFGTVGAYNALGKEGENVEKILATMNSVVGHGHLRLDELTAALSTGLVGTAKTFGISFEGMGSAIAFFTRMSEPAQQAATRLRQTITHLASESTTKAGEAMESIGMNFADMSEKINKTHRLGPIIQELAQHLSGLQEFEKNQILTEAFGGGRYGTQIREAISNVHLLLKTEEEVAHKATVKRLRSSEAAQEKTAAVQMKIMLSSLEAEMIKLGQVLLPIVVPIFQSIVHFLVETSQWFQGLSASTKHWIIVIGLVVIAFAILIRVVGGFIKSMGEIIGWFGKTETANAELIASNEALAASYAEIEASAAASLEARKGMETQYGSYAGGIAANKAGLPTEKDLAPSRSMQASGMLASGKQYAGRLAQGLTSGIPGMFAMYGVGNIITSVVNGDMQDAGFEGGGALIGGIAAVATGNPELAGIGVGIGSLIGEKISGWFTSHPVLSELEQQALQSAKQISTAMGNMRASFSELKEAEGSVKEAHNEVHAAAKNLRMAEEKLETARQEGKGSHTLISDQDQVYNAFRRSTTAIHNQEKALRFQEFAKRNKNASVAEVVHTSKVGIRQSERRIEHLERKEAGGPLTAADIKANGAALRAYNHDVKAYNEAIKVARSVNKGWAESLEGMSGLQNRYGKEGHALKLAIHEQREEVEKLKEATSLKTAPPLEFKELDKAEHKLQNLEGQFGKLKDSLVKNMSVGEKESLAVFDALAGKAGTKFKEMGGGLGLVLQGLSAGLKSFDPKINLKSAHGEVKKMETGVNDTKTAATELNSNLHQKFQPGLIGVFKVTSQRGEEWAEVTSEGFSRVNTQASNIVKAWGGTPPSLVKGHEKGKEVVKKARGGHLPGNQTGDRIPALLEDGEYVVNREAVKKIGVHNLNAINFGMAPRFAEGGAVQRAAAEAESLIGTPYHWGGGHGGWGESNALDCSGVVSYILHAAGLLNKPEVSGELESWGLPGPGPITVHANAGHAWMSIMGKPFGTSVNDSSKGTNWYPKPDPAYAASFVTRHADVAAAELAGGAQSVIPSEVAGVGAAAGTEMIAGVAKAANEYIAKNEPGQFGGGDFGEFPSGNAVKEMGETLLHGGFNRIGAAGVMGNAWQESSWDPSSEGSGGAGLLGFTAGEISAAALKAAAATKKVPWDNASFQMAFALEHIDGGIKSAMNGLKSPGESAKYFMENWEHPAVETENLARREEGARKAYAMGYAKGGPAKQINKIFGELHHGTHDVAAGHSLKGFAEIKKGVRKLGKVQGLGDKQVEALITGTEKIQQLSEYASNAGAGNTLEEQKPNRAMEEALYNREKLEYEIGKPNQSAEVISSKKAELATVKESINVMTRQEEEWYAKTVFGTFKGHDEGFWLKSELETMATMRNNLLTSKQSIKGPEKAINEQVKKFKHMLHLAEKHVREYTQKQHDIEKAEKLIEKEEREAIQALEKQKHEIEEAEHAGQHKLEKEKNELENQLNQLQNAKHPDQGAISGVRAQLKGVNESLHNVQSGGANGVKAISEKIHEVEHDDKVKLTHEHEHKNAAIKHLHEFERQVSSYTEELIPAAEEKRTVIDETAAGLMTGYAPTEGPFKNRSWEGLNELQGSIDFFKKVNKLPEFPNGQWGGNILTVQQGLESYATVNKPPAIGLGLHFEAPEEEESQESSVAKELKELEKEIEGINLQRERIRQVQGPVMESFPSVHDIAIPFAGAYAKGGLVAAEVGERGKEIAVMPQGTQMVSHYDAKDALGSGNINFEHMEFHEADNSVHGRVNGIDFHQEIKEVNRKQAQDAITSRTPGGLRK